jgi:4-amino-4-deoxy-L-arabinose transferase-like glycosyltransferase
MLAQNKNSFLSLALLVLIGLLAFFPGLGKGSLWDRDETHYAEIAREMFLEKSWAVPSFNGKAFLHKPVFAYWMIGLAYRLFGVSEFSARFFSAVFGLGTCILTFYIGRLLYDNRTGFLSGLILATGLLPLVIFRAAVTDAYLVFFITGICFFFLKAIRSEKKGYYYTCYILMGLATLVKGPIGVVLPAGIIFCYLLSSRKLNTLKQMHLLSGVAIIILIVLPWFLKIYSLMGDKFISDFIVKHHLRRFSHPMEGHGGPFWLYIPVILIGFFPWSAFSIQSYKATRNSDPDAYRFLLGWFGVVFVLFSLASTKLPHYILPLFPALALAFGLFWDRVLSAKEAEAESLIIPLKVNFIFAILLLIGTLVIYFIRFEIASIRLVLNMAILAGGSWLTLKAINKKKLQTVFWILPSMQILFVMYAFYISIPWVERFRTVIPLASEVGRLAQDKEKVFAFEFFEPGLVFYSGRRVEKIDSIEQIGENGENRFFLFIRKKDFDKLNNPSPLYLISEKNGINEVKGDLHLMLFSNYPQRDKRPAEG